MISKSFIKSSVIYTLAGTLPMASALILLPFYIYHLSTEVYGALSIYLGFSLLMQIIVTFSFDTSVYIHFHEFKNDGKKLATFISSAFVFMLLTGLGIGIIFAGLGDFIFRLALPGQNVSFYPYGIASVGAGAFQALFKVHSSLLQTREKPETFFWSNVLSFTLIASFTIIGLELYPNSLMGPIVGRLLAAMISGVWVLIRIFREFGIKIDFTWLTSSFSFNTYTFIYQILQWINNYFDRIVMLVVLSLADIGVYVFATNCLIALELLMNSLHSSFYPKVVSQIMAQPQKHSSPDINRYYHGLMAVIMITMCITIFLLPWMIEAFVKKAAYQATIPYLPFLATIYLFRTMRLFFTVPYGILKYTKPLPLVYIVVAALKIGLMLLLMPSLKLYGVVIASLVSSAVEVFLLRFSIKSMFIFRFNFFKIV
ncbi:MAG TPA: oligosaccharide flippase family protein, partial [Chryseolinea sp.]|nr:oligosaccharide flippase family protein [Chryseolinea sp.]